MPELVTSASLTPLSTQVHEWPMPETDGRYPDETSRAKASGSQNEKTSTVFMWVPRNHRPHKRSRGSERPESSVAPLKLGTRLSCATGPNYRGRVLGAVAMPLLLRATVFQPQLHRAAVAHGSVPSSRQRNPVASKRCRDSVERSVASRRSMSWAWSELRPMA